MIDVAILSVIRRWALREQLSIREISRRTGLSRNTIRKYLRSDVAEPSYAKRVSSSKLDPFTARRPACSGVHLNRDASFCATWWISAAGCRPLSTTLYFSCMV